MCGQVIDLEDAAGSLYHHGYAPSDFAAVERLRPLSGEGLQRSSQRRQAHQRTGRQALAGNQELVSMCGLL